MNLGKPLPKPVVSDQDFRNIDQELEAVLDHVTKLRIHVAKMALAIPTLADVCVDHPNNLSIGDLVKLAQTLIAIRFQNPSIDS